MAEEGKFVSSPFAADAQPGDKIALVMIHFGTTHDDTRAKTIDVLNQEVRKAFPHWDFYEAYTSRIIIERLKKRGMVKSTPKEVYQHLADQGYKYVIIQSSNIIDGIEMEAIRKEIANVRHSFKDIRLGNCLLYSPDDYSRVINTLQHALGHYDADIVYVGHGTYTPATATYAMFDYMLHDKGYPHSHVGTIEGYPGLEQAMKYVRQNQAQSVVLVPLMFVAGEHAKNDIEADWREQFEKAGLHVDTHLEGLGEQPGIRALLIEHLQFAANHKEWDILDKKTELAKEESEIQ